MNCQACPYQKQIDELRCRCLACNPDSTGGRPHGAIVADDYTLNAASRAADYNDSPSERATNLSEDDENKLRIAMMYKRDREIGSKSGQSGQTAISQPNKPTTKGTK